MTKERTSTLANSVPGAGVRVMVNSYIPVGSIGPVGRSPWNGKMGTVIDHPGLGSDPHPFVMVVLDDFPYHERYYSYHYFWPEELVEVDDPIGVATLGESE